MSWIAAHLTLIALPALGVPAGLLLALAGQVKRSHQVRRTGLVILLVASLSGLITFAVGRQAAREAVATIPGIDRALIERHATGAEAARLGLIVLALASAGVLAVRRDSGALPWLVGGLVVFGLVVTLLVARAAVFGGSIRHPELRGSGVAAGPA